MHAIRFRIYLLLSNIRYKPPPPILSHVAVPQVCRLSAQLASHREASALLQDGLRGQLELLQSHNDRLQKLALSQGRDGTTQLHQGMGQPAIFFGPPAIVWEAIVWGVNAEELCLDQTMLWFGLCSVPLVGWLGVCSRGYFSHPLANVCGGQLPAGEKQSLADRLQAGMAVSQREPPPGRTADSNLFPSPTRHATPARLLVTASFFHVRYEVERWGKGTARRERKRGICVFHRLMILGLGGGAKTPCPCEQLYVCRDLHIEEFNQNSEAFLGIMGLGGVGGV